MSAYKKILLNIGPEVKITDSEVECILDLVDAAHIAISDSHDIPYKMSQKTARLKRMRALERLSIVATRSSFEQLLLRNIMAQLPNIQTIDVFVGKLSDNEAEAFIEQQKPLLAGWDCRFAKAVSFVQCTAQERPTPMRPLKRTENYDSVDSETCRGLIDRAADVARYVLGFITYPLHALRKAL